MSALGNGLYASGDYADALSMQEAELSRMRRLGLPEQHLLIAQGNLAITYQMLGRSEEANRIKRDVYSGFLKLKGEEDHYTIRAANNYAWGLYELERFEEVKSLLRKTIPAARRVFGESHNLTLRMRWSYARALYHDDDATLDDVRESVTTLEETERTARRVLGGAHPDVVGIEDSLRKARAMLCAGEGDTGSAVRALRELVAAMPPPGSSA